MKHLLLLSLLISLSFTSFNSYATQSDDEEMDLNNVNNGTKPRSVIIVPQAWFNSQTSTIKLQITSQDGIAIVTVKDIMGCEVCSQSVLANGTMQQITLPSYYEADLYTIQIEYGGATYAGQFGAN